MYFTLLNNFINLAAKSIVIIEFLKDIDTQLFLFLNGIHSPFFDVVFEYFSGKFFWIPLYALLFVIAILKLKWRIIYFTLAVVALIFLSDKISVYWFKDVFMRYRPCHNLDISHLVHLVDGCGGKYGFVSSHAANTFALATYLGIILKKHFPKMLLWMLIWAAVVSYSRIYLGVHYPADIAVGGILGIVIGLLVAFSLKKLNTKLNLKMDI
ncbi:MAG: phosphatase PAP2 family protein [Flavobacteriales bacterium]|nr:phosphatase PAP2 family protein [Flavobacteriales bacterium]MCW8913327.1 phosphatase PAP2 family protein [Flavobacteriales bacterium]MCW8968937.1 phosphatase PAP2 family protein [Flavobacteriales bacterium]MCW8990303.1 phosphatase PAP2 family protein [Flavobacteriales bacterium]MCW9020284.1 phosphatase PAP2 family protein [Flavobacteriales bacterium]